MYQTRKNVFDQNFQTKLHKTVESTTHSGEFVTSFEMFEENLGEPRNLFQCSTSKNSYLLVDSDILDFAFRVRFYEVSNIASESSKYLKKQTRFEILTLVYCVYKVWRLSRSVCSIY